MEAKPAATLETIDMIKVFTEIRRSMSRVSLIFVPKVLFLFHREYRVLTTKIYRLVDC